MIGFENYINDENYISAENLSEVFEQDSRRFSKALTEEQEALSK